MTQNPKDPPVDPTLELFLDQIQKDHPGSNNDDARAALRRMYDEVRRGEHAATAVEIFGHIRSILLNDLEAWKQQEFSEVFVNRFKTDLRGALLELLTHTYVIIAKNVAYAGGLQVMENKPQDVNKIEVVDGIDQLSESEKIMLKHSTKGPSN